MARPLKVVLSCGGTGGHIMPALAVAARLRQLDPPAEVSFVGTADRLEAKLIPDAGYLLRTIDVRGFARSLRPRSLLRNGALLLRLASLAPLRQARGILRELRPDLVLGTGGYVTGPVLLAAALRRLPTMILEQNANPGLTNRLLAPVVRRIGLPHETAHPFWAKRAHKTVVVGNPVRQAILETTRAEGIRRLGLDSARRTLGCLGGSLGSRMLNERFQQLLRAPELASFSGQLQAVHGCGTRFLGEVEEAGAEGTFPCRLLDFIQDMGAFYAAMDLLVCRGGATTLAEATARGIPMVVVPWEGASNAEQKENAARLVEHGAAIVLSESEVASGKLRKTVAELFHEPRKLAEMRRCSSAVGAPRAAQAVVDELLGLAEAKGNTQ